MTSFEITKVKTFFLNLPTPRITSRKGVHCILNLVCCCLWTAEGENLIEWILVSTLNHRSVSVSARGVTAVLRIYWTISIYFVLIGFIFNDIHCFHISTWDVKNFEWYEHVVLTTVTGNYALAPCISVSVFVCLFLFLFLILYFFSALFPLFFNLVLNSNKSLK